MKKSVRVIIFALLFVVVLGIVFCIVDTLRVHNEEDPMFCFVHKLVDGADYSAEIDTGLGYKIIRYSIQEQPEKIKIGTIFLSEKMQDIIENENVEKVNDEKEISEVPTQPIVEEASGEQITSGEQEVKITTFDEKYLDTIWLEGMEEEVYSQKIHSKMGYTMEYFFELFEYAGFDDHDVYTWKDASGDVGSKMVVTNISEEKAYLETLEKISKETTFEEISGETEGPIEKYYHRTMKENDVDKVNEIYIMVLNELKLKVEVTMPLEAQEGVGAYINKMVRSIS